MSLARITTLSLGGVHYYIHPQSLGATASPFLTTSESLNSSSVGLQSVTPVVVATVDESASVRSVQGLLEQFRLKDDVYTDIFARHIVVQLATGTHVGLSEPLQVVQALEASGAFQEVGLVASTLGGENLPPGPYFVVDRQIHQAWRLYADDLDAFALSIIPDSVNDVKKFSVLDSIAPDGIWRHVAVPSRMYHHACEAQPLAGTRVSIKDIFHIAGVKTTLSSRAYAELYGPQERNADFVDKLIRLGAVIVGKTKTTSFASSDEPTDQWIDFHCPRNPRGDRYQSPSGSSSGAAASLAGYDWLDFSIAGDSAGSVRAPATCNGLFSLRPSFGTTSMAGVEVNSPSFDVVGFFSRGLTTMSHFVSSTLDLQKCNGFPRKIIYPVDFYPHSNADHQAMVEEFILVLERFLGVERTSINIQERWQQCPPEEAKGKSLKEYTAKSAFWPMCRDYYHQFDNYRRDYEEKYDSKPYVSPVVSYRWQVGASLSDEDYHRGWHEQEVFRRWFDDNVMSSDNDTLSDAVMIMPYGSAKPKYRDAPNEAPSSSTTFSEKNLSPVLQMPQLVLPFGQMPYESRVSGRREYRPIASTLMGAKGSDLMLIKLADEAFRASHWPSIIKTGRLMFDLANTTRNVADVYEADGTVTAQL